jgi:hypothetical protein
MADEEDDGRRILADSIVSDYSEMVGIVSMVALGEMTLVMDLADFVDGMLMTNWEMTMQMIM